MSVTQEEVKKISNLGKLRLKDEAKTTADLNNVLGYVEQLNEVDTTGVEGTVNVLNTYNRMREDEIRKEKNPDLFKNTKQQVIADQIAVSNIMK